VGNGPRNGIDEQARQSVLDAAAVLQLQRSRVARVVEQQTSGRRPDTRATTDEGVDVEVVGAGYDAIDAWLHESIPTWRELLSVRPTATLPQLRVSVPFNRRVVADGLKMISLFDHDGTEREARDFLAREEQGSYLFGFASVQVKIVDRRFVLLQGPSVDGQLSVMRVRDPVVMEAAWRYWHAVVASSYQASEPSGLVRPADRDATSRGSHTPEGIELSSRQWRVVTLLATDTRDEAIAEALGVSVRTVRADIADLLDKLGVRTRFAAGLRLGYATAAPHDDALPG
jgi:DNA-binding CsgD family transcriptional regulator